MAGPTREWNIGNQGPTAWAASDARKGRPMAANLTSKARKALPSSTFGLPAERKYPMNDASHAANAKARASQQVAKGNLSTSQERTIDMKANKVIKGYVNGGMVGATGTAPVKLPAQKAPAVVPKAAPGGVVTPTSSIKAVAKSMVPAAVRTKPMGDQPVKHSAKTRGFPGSKV